MTSHLARYEQIADTLRRHSIGYLTGVLGVDRWFPFDEGALGHERRKEPYATAEHLRLTLEELGTAFIKLGQLLSTRADLLPAEYLTELAKLQDDTPPVDFAAVRDMIRQELGGEPEELFREFVEQPLASASIRQAHAAVLLDGTAVVVKLRRPGAFAQVEEDLGNLAAWSDRHSELVRRSTSPGSSRSSSTASSMSIHTPAILFVQSDGAVQTAREEAKVLDLAHGSQYTGSSQVSGGSEPRVLEGADVVVVTAGAKQQPGQSRLEMAAVNARMLKKLMPTLLEQAPDAVYLIVTIPADVLTVAAQRLSGLPSHRIISSGTVLDSSRLRWMLARAIGMSISNVHALVLGEHGDSQFSLWLQARIGPVPIREWAWEGQEPLARVDLDAMAAAVRGSADRVIAGKGATNHAIGLSSVRIVEAILNDEAAILPVSSVLDDFHGITGLALSMPAVIGFDGISQVVDFRMDAEELALLHVSAEVVADTLRSLGLDGARP